MSALVPFEAVAAELAMLSGLTCIVCPSLMEERPR